MIKRFYRKIRYGEEQYFPLNRVVPERNIEVVSAWKGNEEIIGDLIRFTGIKPNKCLEFGVDNGFSTVALSNYFNEVTGVDIFTGDDHSGIHEDRYNLIKTNLSNYTNIKLVKADYKDFIIQNSDKYYDLIHIDIIHTFEDTYKCGLWAAQHADCILFHDTISFMEVINAVKAVSKKTGMKFYHFRELYGLGILCR